MNSTLADEALEIGVVLRESIAAAGGVDLLRRAAGDPRARDEAGELVEAIGLWGLRPLHDQLELEVAAAASEAVGAFALPYPVVERLTSERPHGAVALVDASAQPLVNHGDLPLEWFGVDLDGGVRRLSRGSHLLGTPLATFGVHVSSGPREGRSRATAALATTLQSWWLLGLLRQATADTTQYVRDREQFGRKLIRFQAVGFQLAEMSVELAALGELAKYTLWRLANVGDGALVDAMALRTAALETAGVVLRRAHQLHGAMGFTDEVDVSWLSRASQLARRVPEGSHAAAGRLASLIAEDGWAEFGHTESVVRSTESAMTSSL